LKPSEKMEEGAKKRQELTCHDPVGECAKMGIGENRYVYIGEREKKSLKGRESGVMEGSDPSSRPG